MKNKRIKQIRNEAYKSNKLRKLHSAGNSKLATFICIFNMGDCHNCPSAKLGLCELRKSYKNREVKKDVCYGLKSEKMYPDCLPYRKRQANYWLSVSAETFANEFIEIQKRKRVKFKYIRFNEGGDFYGQDCVNKLFKIAEIIYKETGVKTYTYTHRTDLNFDGLNDRLHYLNILKSGENFNPKLIRFFTAVPAKYWNDTLNHVKAWNKSRKLSTDPKKYICANDCTKCNLCANFPSLSGVIYNKIH